MLSGSQIRRKFLDYFVQHGHREVHSSSLVPHNDPTLLFTNAGMNQFKDVFLGLEKREYNRATTSQKCVRAGGKHNDLENVGFTNRHLTFFEMLGNFSFGDYFKEKAIAYAWELITGKNWFALPLDKLYFTVFGGAELAGTQLPVDSEAASQWEQVGAPKDRVVAVPGLKENFWAMGDTGPCGPCSEIFYDLGPAASDLGHADCKFGCDCGRYVEIWNLVFMQFNRDARAALNPLPKPSVDTGAGLERVTAVLQGKISNFDTDLFQPLIREAARLSDRSANQPEIQASLRIIADHSRAATFLISDGVIPSNEGRGYVLRKIIRRALRHAHTLGAPSPYLSQMATAVRAEMKKAYPELEEHAARVTRVLDEEEKQFKRTVEVGLAKLDEDLQALAKETNSASFRKSAEEIRRFEKDQQSVGEAVRGALILPPDAIYSGEKAFRLYDTFGLPRDFIEDVLRDSGVKVDWSGFDRALEEQRTRAKASWKGGSG